MGPVASPSCAPTVPVHGHEPFVIDVSTINYVPEESEESEHGSLVEHDKPAHTMMKRKEEEGKEEEDKNLVKNGKDLI